MKFLLTVLAVCASVVIGVARAEHPIDAGELIDAYALQDGGVVVVTYHFADNNSQLVIAYINSDGERDCLRRENLPGALGDIFTEVCGGRLHLTYEIGGGVWHLAIDLPDASLGYLPLVCRADY